MVSKPNQSHGHFVDTSQSQCCMIVNYLYLSAMESNTTDWHTTEIEVKIKETHEDANLILQTGVIRSVSVSIWSRGSYGL